MPWWLYEPLLILAYALYLPSACWRRRLPHRGWGMRVGRYPARVRERLAGQPTVWVHAVSVGEVLAARPLLQALRGAVPQHPIVLSTVTPSGFAVASSQLANQVVPVYVPLDLGWCVRRAMRTLRPRILLLMESELWPVLIREAKRRRVPVAVVNGRISPGAFRRYRLIQGLLGGTLRGVDRFLMQSRADADRVIGFGADPARVQVLGSLKWDASVWARPTPEAIEGLDRQLGHIGRRPLIVAGSTHRGEEEPLLRAVVTLRRTYPDLRLILAPRHLERISEVELLIQRHGLTGQRLSHGPTAHDWAVGLVDAFGQLPLYYGLASLVFIGGSLVPHGGQNPLEAASLGKAILFGPWMHNFAEIAKELTDHGAAVQVDGSEALPGALLALLEARAKADALGNRARELTERSQGVVQRTLDALKPLLLAA